MDEVETLFNEVESAHKPAARWSHWELVIKRARAAYQDVKRIFVEQSKALEIACALMTPEQLEEYRHRAYPKLYPRT